MKIRVGETQTKNAPEPHIPDRIERVLHTVRTFPTSFLRIERTWRSLRSAAAAAAGCGDDFVGGREGLAVIGTAGGNGRYTHRSLPSPWLSPTRPPPHAKSPFVALDGKLLFVRRLRGEFSDDETRSFPNEIRLQFGISSGKEIALTSRLVLSFVTSRSQ